MLPPKNRGTVTYVAPPGQYDISVSPPRLRPRDDPPCADVSRARVSCRMWWWSWSSRGWRRSSQWCRCGLSGKCDPSRRSCPPITRCWQDRGSWTLFSRKSLISGTFPTPQQFSDHLDFFAKMRTGGNDGHPRRLRLRKDRHLPVPFQVLQQRRHCLRRLRGAR